MDGETQGVTLAEELAMPKGQRKSGECVYCLTNTELSRDHVPPKALFPEARRDDLITVPSCDKCNQATAKDEEYVLALLNFGPGGDSLEGQKLKARIDRAYARGTGLVRKMRSSLRVAYEKTPDGILPRRAVVTDMESVDRVLDKIVRGLYYFEYRQPLFQPPSEIVTILKDPRKMWPEDMRYTVQSGSRSWPGIFEYSIGPILALIPDRVYPQPWACRMKFYDAVDALAIWKDPDP
jgi:hypothetical protein